MHISLAVTEGPNTGLVLAFDRHDTFVVGRSLRTSARLPAKDAYLSRFHFLVEVNPPRVRVMDLNSHNGTFVNGAKIAAPIDLNSGDRIKAGHSTFTALIEKGDSATRTETDAPSPKLAVTSDYVPGPDSAERPLPISIANPPPGWTIPGYRLIREIGRGGMGTVFEAARDSDGVSVAVKVVRPAVTPTRKQIDRFLREANILRQLDHPGIVKYHESGDSEELLYFAMEYVPGMDAKQRIKEKGPLSIVAACRITVAVLQALTHAHEKGFVHRDVKPSNVLLELKANKKMGVKLADFGLARVYEESNLSGLTMTGEIGGSPAFMPPEQILDFRNVGPPADIYGASATLYYLLTGKYIFDLPDDPVAAFGLVLDGDPVPVRTRRADVPEGLAAVIEKGFAKEPKGRFANTAEMARGLVPYTV